MATVDEVKRFWEAHPLLSYELDEELGSAEFFARYDEIRAETERYALPLFRFGAAAGQSVLDVGCGNGWVLSQYARHGARCTGVDLTRRAVAASRARFGLQGLAGRFARASAERLPFADASFDLVTSLGVIHHTPRTEQAAAELLRVTRPGGSVLVALYYRNLLLRPWSFPLLKLGLRLLGLRRANDLQGNARRLSAGSVEEFVRFYDGEANPEGKVYTRAEIVAMFRGLVDVETEVHYFPRRFVPALRGRTLPRPVEQQLDRHIGILLYLRGRKPSEALR